MVVLAHQAKEQQEKSQQGVGGMAGDFLMNTPKAMIEFATPTSRAGGALGLFAKTGLKQAGQQMAERIAFPAAAQAILGGVAGGMTDMPVSDLAKRIAGTSATSWPTSGCG